MYFWHQCRRTYHEPLEFKANLSSLIQTMRNVTFRVQSLKDDIPAFETWYEKKWRNFLKNHPYTQWINKARIEVVKKSGLDYKSRAKFKIIYSYEEPFLKEQEVPPYYSTAEIIESAIQSIPKEILNTCLIEITRFWVVEEFPDVELLELTREVFKIFEAMRYDLQKLLCGEETNDPETLVNKVTIHRLLMPLTENDRCIKVNPSTGAIYEYETKIVTPSTENFQNIKNHYPGLFKQGKFPYLDAENLISFANTMASIAIKGLKRDKYHQTILWLRTKKGRWFLIAQFPEDKLDKYILWHRVAEFVEELKADALVCIAEAWMAPIEEFIKQAKTRHIAETKRRIEVLHIYAEDIEGTVHSIFIPFKRFMGKIFTQKPIIDQTPVNFTMPIRKVWSKWKKE